MKEYMWFIINLLLIVYIIVAVIPYGDIVNAWSSGGSPNFEQGITMFLISFPGIVGAISLIIFQRKHEFNCVLKPMKWFNVSLYISSIISCLGQGLLLMFLMPFVILSMPILFFVGLAQDIKISKQNRVK
ncbi:MAG: hypothetical protein PHD15_05840 [Clostridia bacterium]|nr:hypothetical protein [Clostridia bacterium]MDD4387253.1 hypothetical protein [Clostridia bacterium]